MKRVLVLISSVFLFSCSPSTEEADRSERVKTNAEGHREMIVRIDSLEKIVYDAGFTAQEDAKSQLMQDYIKFARLYPGDQEKSPEYLYKAAALSRAVKRVMCVVLLTVPGQMATWRLTPRA
jgi:hypothetical protein